MRSFTFVLALAVSACTATAVNTARTVIEHSAEAGSAVDAELAPRYLEAATNAITETVRQGKGLDEYHRQMVNWDAAVLAIGVVRDALLTAQSIVDTWETGGAERWLQMVACMGMALLHLSQTLETLGVPVPDALTAALRLIGPFTRGACHEGG